MCVCMYSEERNEELLLILFYSSGDSAFKSEEKGRNLKCFYDTDFQISCSS